MHCIHTESDYDKSKQGLLDNQRNIRQRVNINNAVLHSVVMKYYIRYRHRVSILVCWFCLGGNVDLKERVGCSAYQMRKTCHEDHLRLLCLEKSTVIYNIQP
jgi:hypothetical protein